jgi:hypothetical protein
LTRSVVSLGVTLVALFTTYPVMGQSADPFMGTWRANLAKSTYSPGPPPKSSIIKEEPAEGGIKVTIDGVDALGQTTHAEWVGQADGKDYPVKGAPGRKATRSLARIDNRTREVINKADGKLVNTVRIVLSPDGKIRTDTLTGTDSQGRTVKNVMVREKQ